MSERLQAYVRSREEGHTREFFLAAITNSATPSSKVDRDMKALLAAHPLLPPSWLKKVESGTITNKAGQAARRTTTTTLINGKEVTREQVHVPKVDEVCRWVAYQLTDGEIAWRYTVQFKADGSLDYVRESRYDAKDYDPEYQKIIKEVESEVTAQMTKTGNDGLGSSLTFWLLKKEKLRLKGINWRSPAELNPNTSFD
ncbi:MAG TPA: hypothetical protein VNZ22_00810 [Bacillota bacterium]|nr:hypothetical protein [Bacillota bacterium]